MAYWAAVRIQTHHERLALHCLGLAGFEVYLPRLRERRTIRGRRVETTSALFPGYCFVLIELQWHAARWAPGTLGLIMDGEHPAKVSEAIIDAIRSRERGGLVELPVRGPRRGAPVRVISGPLAGLQGLYAGQAAHARVKVLLSFFGGLQRIELPIYQVEW